MIARDLVIVFIGCFLLAIWFAKNTAPLTVEMVSPLEAAAKRVIEESYR